MTITWKVPGFADLTLDDTNGMRVQSLNVGAPTTRGVSSDLPLADGTDDTTTYVGARAVSIGILLRASTGRTRLQNRDALAQRCHPGLRGELVYDADLLCVDGSTRRILVRADQVSAPVDNPISTAVQVTLIGYTGLIEAITATVLDVPPLPAAEGAEFDWEWPVVWPEAAPEPTTATSAGTMAAWPTIRIDGPCAGPAVWCGDKVLSFPGFEVEAGHFLLIDSAARTVLLDGVTDRRSALDAAVSSWWQIQPGDNDVMFVPERSGSPSTVTVTWRDAFFL